MTGQPIPGLTESVRVARLDVAHGSVTLTVDAGLYPVEAVYGAAYVFLDRCYVLLDRTEDGRLSAALASKRADADEGALRAMAGEFCNELLSQAWRLKLTEQNRALLEAVTARALAGALGAPSLDELAAFDFGEDPLEDPLGIAVSWEEKYLSGRKPGEPPPGDAPEGPEGEGGGG